MKKIFYAICTLGLVAMLACCSKSGDEPIDESNSPSYQEPGQTSDPIDPASGTASRPTDWIIISDIDPTGQMTVTIDSLNMPAPVNDNDLLAAFVGTECRGNASPQHDPDGVTRFSMVINQCADTACTQGNVVELRYYSEVNKRIYTSDAFNYVRNRNLGSAVSGSYKTNWK